MVDLVVLDLVAQVVTGKCLLLPIHLAMIIGQFPLQLRNNSIQQVPPHLVRLFTVRQSSEKLFMGQQYMERQSTVKQL